jgi:hypothetical protein
MKNRLFLLLTLAVVLTQFGAAVLTAAVAIGQPAPDFQLKDIHGNAHKLSGYKGKVVVLEWNNPECPFVVKNYEKSGNLPKMQAAAVAEGVVWLTINSGASGKQGGDYSDARLGEYLSKNHAAPTAYLPDHDGKVGRLYGAKTTPHIFIVNSDGTLVYEGAIDSIASTDPEDIAKATNYVRATLDALKAGKPVAKATTQPYGCSVKY